ncbi:F0F1 ATP synthase subunit gamma [Aestuariirhabdus sp. LZHN29]|uniref:F0F1 ATP synthase subunit gamma n=1 Tax=Aestuariirhabdus sp. LZHN29 TaxID=3417462 RepID=UPI003CF4DB76
MSTVRELKGQIHRLSEIGDIMAAMKNLAFMETRKLERHLNAQKNMVERIRYSAGLCISHFPRTLPEGSPEQTLCVMFGSERGFCGDFNQRLILQGQSYLDDLSVEGVITLGHRLNQRSIPGQRLLAALPGASASEEVESVLVGLAGQLDTLEQELGSFALVVLSHYPEGGMIQLDRVLPPFRDILPVSAAGVSPLLGFGLQDLMLGLGEHYLMAELQRIICCSLMAENQQRIIHLQGAIQKLEQHVQSLQRRSHRMRQEAIIEEIEIILMNQTEFIEDPDASCAKIPRRQLDINLKGKDKGQTRVQ